MVEVVEVEEVFRPMAEVEADYHRRVFHWSFSSICAVVSSVSEICHRDSSTNSIEENKMNLSFFASLFIFRFTFLDFLDDFSFEIGDDSMREKQMMNKISSKKSKKKRNLLLLLLRFFVLLIRSNMNRSGI